MEQFGDRFKTKIGQIVRPLDGFLRQMKRLPGGVPFKEQLGNCRVQINGEMADQGSMERRLKWRQFLAT